MKFADNSSIDLNPYAFFIDSLNTVLVARLDNGEIRLWSNAIVHDNYTIVASLSTPRSLFVTSDEQIFVDKGNQSKHCIIGCDPWGFRCAMTCTGLRVWVCVRIFCLLTDTHTHKMGVFLPIESLTRESRAKKELQTVANVSTLIPPCGCRALLLVHRGTFAFVGSFFIIDEFLSIDVVDEDGTEIPFATRIDQSVEIVIPQDTSLIIASMSRL